MKEKNIFTILLAFAAALLFTGCQNNKKKVPFSLKDLTPTVLDQKGNELFEYWEFENIPSLWESNLGPVVAMESFRDSLEMVLGKESFLLAVQKEAGQTSALDTLHSKNGDAINAQLVHSGTVGKIRQINFLESELLNYQLTRYPLLSHPTELHGFILLHDSLNHVRVYFAASDQPWPPKPTVIIESIKKDLKQGWNLTYHLHNHYEPKTNNYVGILAPSLADAQFFGFLSQDFALQNALITNGFHTVEIKSREFSKLKLPDNH